MTFDIRRTSELKRCCNETIAYVIDATRIHFAGQYRLQASLKNPGDQLVLDESLLATTTEWTLRPDEPLAISNVAITLLDSDASGALVKVTTVRLVKCLPTKGAGSSPSERASNQDQFTLLPQLTSTHV